MVCTKSISKLYLKCLEVVSGFGKTGLKKSTFLDSKKQPFLCHKKKCNVPGFL